jgi:hypothetical protein
MPGCAQSNAPLPAVPIFQTTVKQLSPMTVAIVANRPSKYFILLVGGPGKPSV